MGSVALPVTSANCTITFCASSSPSLKIGGADGHLVAGVGLRRIEADVIAVDAQVGQRRRDQLQRRRRLVVVLVALRDGVLRIDDDPILRSSAGPVVSYVTSTAPLSPGASRSIIWLAPIGAVAETVRGVHKLHCDIGGLH